ncbi:MAG: hypothetical protein E6I42_08840 [Chloroflexi bacterium]|nr:MAG: hypothetical protein E6I42_08840 [Chloroflexota bacterium]
MPARELDRSRPSAAAAVDPHHARRGGGRPRRARQIAGRPERHGDRCGRKGAQGDTRAYV